MQFNMKTLVLSFARDGGTFFIMMMMNDGKQHDMTQC